MNLIHSLIPLMFSRWRKVEWMTASLTSFRRLKARDWMTSVQTTSPLQYPRFPPLASVFPQMPALGPHKFPARKTTCLKLCGSFKAAGSKSRDVRCPQLGKQNRQPQHAQDGEIVKSVRPAKSYSTSSLPAR